MSAEAYLVVVEKMNTIIKENINENGKFDQEKFEKAFNTLEGEFKENMFVIEMVIEKNFGVPPTEEVIKKFKKMDTTAKKCVLKSLENFRLMGQGGENMEGIPVWEKELESHL